MSKNHNVSIRVINAVDKHVGEPLFITGDFNNWHPASWQVGVVPKAGGDGSINLGGLEEGVHEFRLTRGSWHTLACDEAGRLGQPYELHTGQDAGFELTIEGWRDDFPLSTAGPQVSLLEDAFFFPEMGVHKRIWIYLPQHYALSNDRYPVIYMHDGQHLFDEATAPGRKGPIEWRVDKTIDRSQHDAIVVAIAHADGADERKNEYFTNPSEHFPQPRGRAYLADVVHTLKPHIDGRFRTLSGKWHTAMVGSSVGGLLTLYAGTYYPEVFGTLGVFSPSIWLDERQVFDHVACIAPRADFHDQHYYFYGGGRENRAKPKGGNVDMQTDVLDAIRVMERTIKPGLSVKINPQGKHGALYWQGAFADFFEWWMGKVKNEK